MARFKVSLSITYETSLDVESKDRDTAWEFVESVAKDNLLSALIEKAGRPRVEVYEIEEIDE